LAHKVYRILNPLQAVAPVQCLANIDIPVLFMNGSEDYRNSEEAWLKISIKANTSSNTTTLQVQSELKVYEGGDHFFMHDSRFVNDILESIHAFAEKVSKKKKNDSGHE
jgi:pimeloyl-ACP methyl ester carboxylesterase